jgi:hypothetical protein
LSSLNILIENTPGRAVLLEDTRMKMKDLESKTLPELRGLAKEWDVKLSSRMRKSEIVSVLSSHLGHLGQTKGRPSTLRRGASPTVQKTGKAGEGRVGVPPRKITAMRPTAGLTPEEAVESAKFEVTDRPEAGRRETLFPPEALPEGYGTDVLRLMARDPYWAHAYWEVTWESMEKARSAVEDRDARLTLRIFDATEQPDQGPVLALFDIEVFQREGNWYLEMGRPDRTFYAEVGVKGKDGTFRGIARSNPIQTPPDRVSERTDIEWMTSEEDFQRVFALSGGHGTSLSSGEMVSRMERGFFGEVTSPGVSSPGITSPGISSPGVWSPGGAWGVSSAGPAPRGEEQRRRDFWFWVNTELIVYGATEPDATVTFQGKPVDLRPDGTFSLRFALPDGVQVMPIRAASADRVEERVITPIVSRETQ